MKRKISLTEPYICFHTKLKLLLSQFENHRRQQRKKISDYFYDFFFNLMKNTLELTKLNRSVLLTVSTCLDSQQDSLLCLKLSHAHQTLFCDFPRGHCYSLRGNVLLVIVELLTGYTASHLTIISFHCLHNYLYVNMCVRIFCSQYGMYISFHVEAMYNTNNFFLINDFYT